MLVLDAEQVRAASPWPALVDALGEMFRAGCHAPTRHHHELENGVGPGTLLIMPAWQSRMGLGVKLVTVFPKNRLQGLPAIAGLYALFDGHVGTPKAILDGGELTARRTAATSALAASLLARRDARTLTMVGTGRLSTNLIEAHSSVRPLEKIFVWGRNPLNARKAADGLGDARVTVTDDLEAAVRQSDIVSCATLSSEPLVRGAWLQPGVHLDLVGAFKPSMRETDAAAWQRADAIVVDTLEGARHEAGDILQAEQEGVVVASKLQGSLFELASGGIAGRSDDVQITVFKSVGTAQADLAAAHLAVSRHSA